MDPEYNWREYVGASWDLGKDPKPLMYKLNDVIKAYDGYDYIAIEDYDFDDLDFFEDIAFEDIEEGTEAGRLEYEEAQAEWEKENKPDKKDNLDQILATTFDTWLEHTKRDMLEGGGLGKIRYHYP
jgi:hypothetical protein